MTLGYFRKPHLEYDGLHKSTKASSRGRPLMRVRNGSPTVRALPALRSPRLDFTARHVSHPWQHGRGRGKAVTVQLKPGESQVFKTISKPKDEI